MQRIALVMVEKGISRWRNGARTYQAADDAAAAQSELIGIGEIELGAVAEPWRAQCQFPAVDSCGLHVNREEDVGVIQTVVIEEVRRTRQKIVGIEHPAFEGNGDAELVLFIPFAM